MTLEPNPDVFSEEQGLENAVNDKELYIDVLRMLLEETKKDKKLFEEYMETGDWKQYEILVHALKNNLRIAGALMAGGIALDLELHCKSAEYDYVKEHHQELLDAITLANKYIRQYLWDKG